MNNLMNLVTGNAPKAAEVSTVVNSEVVSEKQALIRLKTFELLDNTGLNWIVEKKPLFAQHTSDETLYVPTESFGIMRNDTQQHLGTVGKQYVPFQNYQLAETIIEATDSLGIETTRGGQLSKGSQVYLQSELPKEFIGKSDLRRFITSTNSHDGSSAISFGSSNVNIICTNTFHKANKELMRFRHTASAAERLTLAIQVFKNSIKADEQLMVGFKKMADLQLKDEAIERVLRSMFKLDGVTDASKINAQTKTRIDALAGSLSTSQAEQGNTIWALFNAVTRYTNHVAAPKEAAAKDYYLMSGKGYDTNLACYNELMRWVDENTAEIHAVTA
ncbi:LGT_TIGR03299, phage/plasmid-like protein TIGR03299 [uncultured Caudovirales phage]|uniref:LGT_TIGR03299, phage/plasmid-like protein TIGR03299 n=1 Tax=uncultured Caudovirales phage TaxID=2100421 RepID=A0A6J5N2I8_9CAUD|nr:LGT_TIGR03299, phage/plasmid-like protein TIGR03299 [uncultured Caudovirales phage]